MGRKKSGFDEFAGGLALTLVFGVLFLSRAWGWWTISPLVFGGVMPMLSGLRRLHDERRSLPGRNDGIDDGRTGGLGGSSRGLAAQRSGGRSAAPADSERQILRVARDHAGIVTPTLVALETSVTLDEADRLLQQFASRGFAVMHVRNDGRIEYHFAEFQGPLNSPDDPGI